MFRRAVRAVSLIAASCGVLLCAPVSALECGETVYTSVMLTADLICSGPAPALIVGADGVAVSLNGRTISNRSGDGIAVSDRIGVTIKGPGLIYWAGNGIRAIRTDRLTVQGVRFALTSARGIDLVHSQRAVIRGNRFEYDAVFGAVDIRQPLPLPSPPLPAGQHTVADNRFIGVTVGVRACGADAGGNQITGNWFEYISEESVALHDEAAANQISYNKFLGGNGLVVIGTNANLFFGNAFENRGELDVEALPVYGCHRRDATARAFGNRIEANHFYASAYPISLGRDKAGDVSGNRIVGNTLTDATVGIHFGPGARYNDGRGNTFVRAVRAVVDEGIGNDH